MDIEYLFDNLELLAEQVHNAWMEEKIKQGFHAPINCSKFEMVVKPQSKFSGSCDNCHADMYPYSELREYVKEYDRVTVRAVLNTIKNMEYDNG